MSPFLVCAVAPGISQCITNSLPENCVWISNLAIKPIIKFLVYKLYK